MASDIRALRVAVLSSVALIAGVAGYGLHSLTGVRDTEPSSRDGSQLTRSIKDARPGGGSAADPLYSYDEVVKCIVSSSKSSIVKTALSDDFSRPATDASFILKCYSVADLLATPRATTTAESESGDFDQLIDLIVSTVEHDSWMENGTGAGEIQPFPTKNSLIISQTERVHEQIADLLEQLRELEHQHQAQSP